MQDNGENRLALLYLRIKKSSYMIKYYLLNRNWPPSSGQSLQLDLTEYVCSKLLCLSN